MIQVFPSGPFSTNAYLAVCRRTHQVAIIDPAPGSFQALADAIEAQKLTPKALLLTHSHWDHIADVSKIKAKYNIPVYIHSQDAPNLEAPGSDRLPCWIHIEPVIPEVLLNEGDYIDIGDIHFKVIHAPGHTPGGVCFYSENDRILMSGDTLFKGTIGNISFPTSNPADMWVSLEKLSRLPAETKVYPGHGPSTTIGAEHWLSKAEEVFGD